MKTNDNTETMDFIADLAVWWDTKPFEDLKEVSEKLEAELKRMKEEGEYNV